ncbi:hypothetical protein [Parvicella tangerina]|uniref:Lipoprotein n=1 Tax=Parvicella tangerina TaxID=2829795 RepID=A0A916N8R1_9FLAO|nr:hypothetical protein [Parvicella tangerina]CAG5077476.1 hypothetical protein CRYO30217_00398 [Parvicella tangerina]
MKLSVFVFFFSFLLISCAKKEGCTDTKALNYNPNDKVSCCCNYNGFVSFYTKKGYQNGDILIYIDSVYVIKMEGIYTVDHEPSCNTGYAPVENVAYLEDGSHYYECIQSDSTICSGNINTSTNSCLYIEVN